MGGVDGGAVRRGTSRCDRACARPSRRHDPISRPNLGRARSNNPAERAVGFGLVCHLNNQVLLEPFTGVFQLVTDTGDLAPQVSEVEFAQAVEREYAENVHRGQVNSRCALSRGSSVARRPRYSGETLSRSRLAAWPADAKAEARRRSRPGHTTRSQPTTLRRATDADDGAAAERR
jgi:hypothetical protein